MRLVTWNCSRGAFDKMVPLLDSLAADIAVVQECQRPHRESEHCAWFGDNPRQGIAVVSSPSYRLITAPTLQDVPKFVVPLSVEGPANFTLFAVWTKFDPLFKYVRGAVRAIEMYREVFAGGPCVLMGDFNSSAIWDDRHPAGRNHSALVELVRTLGLTSAYHGFFGEAQGGESRPTYYHRRKLEEPFHIDYCFVPSVWMRKVRNVEIGEFEAWKTASDHRPIIVDIDT